MAENIVDPKYEYDAPVYMDDLPTLASDKYDGADEWFGKTKAP